MCGGPKSDCIGLTGGQAVTIRTLTSMFLGQWMEFLPRINFMFHVYKPQGNPIENLFGTVKVAFKPERRLLAMLQPGVMVGRVKDIIYQSGTAERCSNWIRGIFSCFLFGRSVF